MDMGQLKLSIVCSRERRVYGKDVFRNRLLACDDVL